MSRPGAIYKHFKGGLYRVMFRATDANTDKVVVVYMCLKTGGIFVRDEANFNEMVNPNPGHLAGGAILQPRFSFVEWTV